MSPFSEHGMASRGPLKQNLLLCVNSVIRVRVARSAGPYKTANRSSTWIRLGILSALSSAYE
jgi:hypothetical protein